MATFADNFKAIFGVGNPPAPQASQQQQVTNNPQTNTPTQTTQQTAQTDANGVVPQNGNKPPLEDFKNLWQPPSAEELAANPPQANVSVDPGKLMEAAGKVDFSKVLNQESLSKIAAGGEDAIAALTQILNQSSQTVYGQSMVAANRMVEEAVKLAEQRFAAQVPQLVKKQAAQESLFSENPAFQNPALSPIIHAVQSQLQEKFPRATTVELNEMAKKMLGGAAELIQGTQPKAKTSEDKTKAQDDDWTMYLQGSN